MTYSNNTNKMVKNHKKLFFNFYFFIFIIKKYKDNLIRNFYSFILTSITIYLLLVFLRNNLYFILESCMKYEWYDLSDNIWKPKCLEDNTYAPVQCKGESENGR